MVRGSMSHLCVHRTVITSTRKPGLNIFLSWDIQYPRKALYQDPLAN